MKHGSLFSGIGGFDLAAEWMGWENVFHCEWNPFGQKILNHYWPNAKSYGDITKTDFTEWRGKCDIVTGGFPCQPYSTAGKRKGKEDDRHLWPEMLRAIREIQPTWIVGENVPGLLNWGRGMVLAEIKTDLEASGFEVFPPVILPACGKNAPHRRDRLWIVAHNSGTKLQKGSPINEWQEPIINNRGSIRNNDWSISNGRPSSNTHDGKQGEIGGNNEEVCGFQNEECGAENGSSLLGRNIIKDGDATNSECIGQQGSGSAQESIGSKTDRNWKASWVEHDGGWPTQSPICSGDDGISSELDGITLSKWRKESLMGAGNAIVPQVAYEIFKAIEAM